MNNGQGRSAIEAKATGIGRTRGKKKLLVMRKKGI